MPEYLQFDLRADGGNEAIQTVTRSLESNLVDNLQPYRQSKWSGSDSLRKRH